AASNAGAPAQEVLDLLLVVIGLGAFPQHLAQPQMLRKGEHGLARRVAEAETSALELAIVERPSVPQLTLHLGRQLDADPAERGGREAGTDRRQDRKRSLAEQTDYLGEGQHAVRRYVVDPAQVFLDRVL